MRIQLPLKMASGRTQVAKAESAAGPLTQSVTIDVAAHEKLLLLAQALGRQSARRHLSRGRSIVEIALLLALAGLVLACLMHGGFLPAATNLHGPG